MGLGVAELVHDLLDHRLVDRVDFGLEPEVLEIAELHLRPDLDNRLEKDGFALLALGNLDLGRCQRLNLLVTNCLAVGLVDELLQRLIGIAEGRAPARAPRGALARPEAGDAGLTRERPTAWSMARERRRPEARTEL